MDLAQELLRKLIARRIHDSFSSSVQSVELYDESRSKAPSFIYFYTDVYW